MGQPQGKGRGANARQQVRRASEVYERSMRVAALPTGQPRPDWMQDPGKLPRKPPRPSGGEDV